MSAQLVPANTDSYLGSISFTQLTAEQLAVAFRGLFVLKQLRLQRVGRVEQPLLRLANKNLFLFCRYLISESLVVLARYRSASEACWDECV